MPETTPNREGERVLFTERQKIVMIGDSITDCGRRDVNAPYGNGYVSLVRAMILARYPERHLTFVNRGIGGDTTRHLAARWQEDVIDERPDWLSCKIGINDVWRSYDSDGQGAVPLDEYTATLERLLTTAREQTGCKLIVMEPYIIDLDRANPMRPHMDEYGLAARKIAHKLGAVNVRTQEAFDRVLHDTEPEDWADDKVHPNLEGHAVIAEAFLRAVGFELALDER
jgi:lysophospholipase L1-like esterase